MKDEDEEKAAEAKQKMMEELARVTRAGRDSWSQAEAQATARIHHLIDRSLSANLESRLKYDGSSYWGGVKISRNPSILIPVYDVRRLIMMRDMLEQERAQLITAGQELAAVIEEFGSDSDIEKVALIKWSNILDDCWWESR